MTKIVRRLSPAGDFPFGKGLDNYAVGAEATAQRVRTRLLLILGEWFMNTAAGVPWLQLPGVDATPILGGRNNMAYVEAVLKRVILESDGVKAILSFSVDLDHTTRKLTVVTTIQTVDGDTVDIQVISP